MLTKRKDLIKYAFQHQYVEFSVKGEKIYQNFSNYQKLIFILSLHQSCILMFFFFFKDKAVIKYLYFLYIFMRIFYVKSALQGCEYIILCLIKKNLAYGTRREICYAGDQSGQAALTLKSFFFPWKSSTAIKSLALGLVRSSQISVCLLLLVLLQ